VSDSFNTQTHRIISRSGERIGVLALTSHDTHVQLEKIYLLPAHQNQGIGSSLIRQLMQHAAQQRKPLRLRVLRVNPARRLYERLGFAATFTTLEPIYMEYRARERVQAGALAVRANEDS
jgi:ribosomal protein S18 acetylase RimI-like enzyme